MQISPELPTAGSLQQRSDQPEKASRLCLHYMRQACPASPHVFEGVDILLLERGLERTIENERAPSKAEDEASWLRRIAEIDLKQERLLDLRLDGDITSEQFRARCAELKDARVATQDQLEASRSRLSWLKDLERSKDALVSHYASLVPVGLEGLSPADKNKVYEMMHLRVFAHPDDTLIADWGCNVSPLPRWSSESTTPAFRFRAILDGSGAEWLELVRA